MQLAEIEAKAILEAKNRRCRIVPCQILTLDVTARYKVLFSAK